MFNLHSFGIVRMICPHKTTLRLAYASACIDLVGASRELLRASRELLVLNFAVGTNKTGQENSR